GAGPHGKLALDVAQTEDVVLDLAVRGDDGDGHSRNAEGLRRVDPTGVKVLKARRAPLGRTGVGAGQARQGAEHDSRQEKEDSSAAVGSGTVRIRHLGPSRSGTI